MTREEFEAQVDKSVEQMKVSLKMRCMRLVKTGAVDMESFDKEDWLLLRVVMTAALEDETDQYRPTSPKYKSMVKNLRHF